MSKDILVEKNRVEIVGLVSRHKGTHSMHHIQSDMFFVIRHGILEFYLVEGASYGRCLGTVHCGGVRKGHLDEPR